MGQSRDEFRKYKNTVSIEALLKALKAEADKENVKRATPSEIMEVVKGTLHHFAKEAGKGGNGDNHGGNHGGKDGKEGDMVVFLKVSEEATCDPDDRAWVYTNQIPILENITTTFDNLSL